MNPGYGFKCKMGSATYKSLMFCDVLPFTRHTGHTFEMAGPGQNALDTETGKTESLPRGFQA